MIDSCVCGPVTVHLQIFRPKIVHFSTNFHLLDGEANLFFDRSSRKRRVVGSENSYNQDKLIIIIKSLLFAV